MNANPPGRTLLLQEHGCLIISIQSALSDQELRELCLRVIRLDPHKFRAAILDLTGIDVADSFSVQALQNLCKALRLFGTRTVIAGIQPGIALSMAVRGLDIEHTHVASDLEDALAYVAEHEHRRPHLRIRRSSHHRRHRGDS
jgi:anti-anti-sigma regulatory factor